MRRLLEEVGWSRFAHDLSHELHVGACSDHGDMRVLFIHWQQLFTFVLHACFQASLIKSEFEYSGNVILGHEFRCGISCFLRCEIDNSEVMEIRLGLLNCVEFSSQLCFCVGLLNCVEFSSQLCF